MSQILALIAKPFGLLLLWLYNLVGNYGIAIFLFALVVKLIMLPFQMKTKKSMMRMAALNPQLQELQKRHEGNPKKLQEETAKLYKEEKVNPMSGCLWSLIPYPILLALYRAIRMPLTTMMGVPEDLLAEGGTILSKLNELGFTATGKGTTYLQLQQSEFISQHFSEFAGLSDKLVNINYNFLGLNMGSTPKLLFWQDGLTWLSIGLFLIPIVSALLSWLQMKISQKTNPAPATQNAQQATSMKTMNLMMPLISLWIGFSMPAALGMYWIFTSALAIVQELVLNKHYGKLIAAEAAERNARQRAREAEFERKRAETERLRAEGLTKENTNTSKRKQQARAKAESDELRAAAIREERAAKRAAMGLPPEEEKPASQVGNRRYARGRAYVEDRFTNPETAAEATAAAAAASEADEALAAEEETEVSEVPAETVTDSVEPAEEAEETVEEEVEEPAEEPEEAEEEPASDETEDADEE